MSSCDITFSDVQAIPCIQDLPAFILRNRLILDKAKRIKARMISLRAAIERNNEIRAQHYFLSPGSDNFGDGPQVTETKSITSAIVVLDRVLELAKTNRELAYRQALSCFPGDDEPLDF